MKKTKYRLQTVLEIRTQKKEEAAKGVAVCLANLENEEIELKRRINILQDCLENQRKAKIKMNEQFYKGLSAHTVLQHRNYIEDLKVSEIELKSEVEQQKQILETAKMQLEISRRDLIESTKELQAIENHKSNWKEVEINKKNKREQKISDEIGLILHGQKKINK